MTDQALDLNAIEARSEAALGPWWRDADRKRSAADVPALIARVRELEARNTNLGIARARSADALDRVAVYGQRLNQMFPTHTVHAEVGREITRLITTNPLPSEQGGE